LIQKQGAKSVFLPLLLLWLAVHAVLLVALLGLKFVVTKSMVIALLLVAGAVFLFTRLRPAPRKLSHSPVV
jgi:predicted lysophospholipase L1 biosynthesis ABC-type transport system permease subunit